MGIEEFSRKFRRVHSDAGKTAVSIRNLGMYAQPRWALTAAPSGDQTGETIGRIANQLHVVIMAAHVHPHAMLVENRLYMFDKGLTVPVMTIATQRMMAYHNRNCRR